MEAISIKHVLDNPIWNALNSGNAGISFGQGGIRYLKRDVGLFAGLTHNNEENLQALYKLLDPGASVILFVPEQIKIPEKWNIRLKREILQMICESADELPVNLDGIKKLSNENIPAMLELTKLTNPGPFFSRTIDFGNYEGIFDGNRLVSMCGRRLQPDPYVEISAVCTHPDYTGKGYAATLLKSQVNSILNESKIPFLHLFPDNLTAFRLYEKMGFKTRKMMFVYFIEKIN